MATAETASPIVGDVLKHAAAAELRRAESIGGATKLVLQENTKARLRVRVIELCTAFVFVSRWFQGSPLEARVEAAIAWVHFNDELQRVGLERM